MFNINFKFMEEKFMFIISSAINHFNHDEFSRFTTEERFNQTIETIKSIRNECVNSYIILFELSETDLIDEHESKIRDLVDLFVSFNNETELKVMYDNFRRHPELFKYGKSLLELFGLTKVFEIIEQENLLYDIKRIFKISGRYYLNGNFNIEDYNSKFLIGKYCCKIYNYTGFENPFNVHYHVFQNKGSLVTALWSLDVTLFYETLEVLRNSFKYLEKMLLYTPGNDIEHSIYHFIDKNKILNCEVLGVTIRKGMDDDDYKL